MTRIATFSHVLTGEKYVKAMNNKEGVAVLMVCLGNICRSPTAEGVLRHLVAQQAPDLSSQRAALRRGIDLSGLRARQVTQDDFARFDLILAMDRDNLRELEAMKPRQSHAALKLFLEYAPELNLRDVPDPYYRDAGAFEEVLDLTSAASRGLLASLQHRA